MTTPILQTPVVSGVGIAPEATPEAAPTQQAPQRAPTSERRQYSKDEVLQALYDASERHGLDPKMAVTIAGIESNYNPYAVSSAGAQGLMQLMPGTAKELGVTDPFDLQQNADGGVRYLRQMLDKYKDPVLASMAFNAGPGNIDKYGIDIPFKETQNYRRKFTAAMGLMDGKPQVDPKTGQIDTGGLDLSGLIGGSGGQQEEAPQVNIDPSAFLLQGPTKRGFADKFSDIANSLAMIGGASANAIGSFNGRDGAGNPSIALARSFLQNSQSTKEEGERVNRLNAMISNEGLPKSARNYIGLVANGIPEAMAAKLTSSPDGMEKAAKALQIARSYQAFQEGTPEGKAAAESSALQLFAAKEQIKNSLKPGEKEKVPAKVAEIEKTSQRIIALEGKDSRTAEEEQTLRGLKSYFRSVTKSGLNDQTIGYMKERLFKPGGVVEEYNTAASGYAMFNRLEEILEGIPEGRVEGNLTTYIQKVKGDAAVAEYNTLKTLLTATVARKILKEVGNLNEDEQKRSMETVDVAGKIKEERAVQIGRLKNFLSIAMEEKYGYLGYMGNNVFQEDGFIEGLVESGAIRRPLEDALGRKTGSASKSAETPTITPVDNDFISKFGGKVL